MINRNKPDFLGFQHVEDGDTYEIEQEGQKIALVKFAIDTRMPLEKKVQTHEERYSISCRAKRGEVPIGFFLNAWLAHLNRLKDVSLEQIDSVFGFVDDVSPL